MTDEESTDRKGFSDRWYAIPVAIGGAIVGTIAIVLWFKSCTYVDDDTAYRNHLVQRLREADDRREYALSSHMAVSDDVDHFDLIVPDKTCSQDALNLVILNEKIVYNMKVYGFHSMRCVNYSGIVRAPW